MQAKEEISPNESPKTATTLSRRRFLITAGGVIGAGLFCCSGAVGLGLQSFGVDYYEDQLGKEANMGKRILVAYASKCGSTGEVAATVGETLASAGHSVTVSRVQKVKDLQGYDAVVLGSAARMGNLLPETVRFAERYSAALANLPVAYFSVGITMKEDTTENRQKAEAYFQPLVNTKTPVAALGLFGGKIDYSKLEPIWRLAFSFAKDTLPEGDWRDWVKIRAWAEQVAQAL